MRMEGDVGRQVLNEIFSPLPLKILLAARLDQSQIRHGPFRPKRKRQNESAKRTSRTSPTQSRGTEHTKMTQFLILSKMIARFFVCRKTAKRCGSCHNTKREYV